MSNILISIFILTCSVQLFSISLKTSYLNKTIYNYPKAIIEASLIINDEDHIEPYIDCDLLMSLSDEYFYYSINSNYIFYTISYYFYNPSDGEYCYGEYCMGVEIEFKSKLYDFYTYNKKLNFEVNNNE
ncbi:MAG: hypothetical protein ACI31G_00230 [Bacilli bacterium]